MGEGRRVRRYEEMLWRRRLEGLHCGMLTRSDHCCGRCGQCLRPPLFSGRSYHRRRCAAIDRGCSKTGTSCASFFFGNRNGSGVCVESDIRFPFAAAQRANFEAQRSQWKWEEQLSKRPGQLALPEAQHGPPLLTHNLRLGKRRRQSRPVVCRQKNVTSKRK